MMACLAVDCTRIASCRPVKGQLGSLLWRLAPFMSHSQATQCHVAFGQLPGLQQACNLPYCVWVLTTSLILLIVLMQLWASIIELKDNQWKLTSVASYSDSFEAQLAACKPLELPQLTILLHPPGIALDSTPAEVSPTSLLAIVFMPIFIFACCTAIMQTIRITGR